MTELLQKTIALAAERAEILSRLETKPWYVAADFDVKATVVGLPMDYNGFLEDLAARPDEKLPDGTRQLKLLKVTTMPFSLVAVVFWVETPAGLRYWDQFVGKGKDKKPGPCLKQATYEYISWKSGPVSGTKGIVRLMDNGEPTHIVIVRAAKFATAKLEYDIPGGFGDPASPTLRDDFLREVAEELGFPQGKLPTVLATHELGRLLVDGGQGNNRPYLFCADIDAAEAANINADENPDQWELHGGAMIIPIDKVHDLVQVDEDAYFGSVLLRMVANNLLPVTCLVAASQ